MSRKKTKLATIVAAAAMALSAFAVTSIAAATTTVTWKGVTFETQGSGTATVDSNGDLLLAPTGNNFGLHVNRLPGSINANNTPFVFFSYVEPGNSGQKVDFSINDETVADQPRIEAGSLFGASQVVSATYGQGSTERDGNEEYLFYQGTPTSGASHAVTLGKTADSTLYASFDGETHSSDIFESAGLDFDFNDVLLRVRNGNGTTVRFTGLAYGDDFSPSIQAVPEPNSLAMLGLGGILLLLFARVRRGRA